MSTVEILEELSSKIAEIYNLELATELTDIYVDLTGQIHEDNDKYFELAKKLAEMEVKKDKYKEEYGRVYNEYKRMREAFIFVKEEYKKLLKLREEVTNHLSKELEEERRLRVDAEYDKDIMQRNLWNISINFYSFSKGKGTFRKKKIFILL